jgi:hypothetical protein
VKILAAALLLATTAAAQTPRFRAILDEYAQFDAGDYEVLQRGGVVAKTLPTDEKREVVAFTVTRIDVSPEFYEREFQDIVNFKKSDAVSEIGLFSTPPRIEDLAGLTFPQQDLDDLKKCKPGKCKVRLSDAAMARFQGGIDWSAPDADERAYQLAKEMMVEYITAYLTGGNQALAEYHDKKKAIPLRKDFEDILDQSAPVAAVAPEFIQYLRDFPKAELPGAKNFVYWSKEKFGLKDVISITHVTIYQRKVEGRLQAFIASKQAYASHYFDSSLGITAIVEDEDAEGAPTNYLLYLNRSRTLDLAGSFSGLRRRIVEGRTKDGMEKNMGLMKARLEAMYRAEHSSSR